MSKQYAMTTIAVQLLQRRTSYRPRLACAVLAPFSQFVDRLCTVGLYLNEVGFDLTQDLANSDTEHSLTALNEVNYLIV